MKKNTITTEIFIERAVKIHGNKYDYSKSEYIGSNNKIEIICKIHGSFFKQANSHINKPYMGCPKCAFDLQKCTTEEFIKKAIEIHGDKYDYSKTNYINVYKKIEIICKIHGSFFQKPINHTIRKYGCNKCCHIRQCNTNDQFIKIAKNIHGDKCDYSKTEYKCRREKVKITCNMHGDFYVYPHAHLDAKWPCKECFELSRKTTTNDFIEKAKKIHGDLYDYSKSEYIKSSEKILVICKNHGEFLIKVDAHINKKQGCQKCSGNISNKEISWLDSLKIPKNKNHRHVSLKISNKTFIVDGFDPITNTIYEFYGDYWHGNPEKYRSQDINDRNKKTFGELYQKTIEKEMLLKEEGYKLITIWESDWKKIKK